MKPLAFDRSRINAFGGTNNCFPVALAQDWAWATGQWTIAPVSAGDVPTSAPEIVAELRRRYGELRPNGLLPERLKLHRCGLPAPMSPADIAAELGQAGRGARGFVFVDGVNGPDEPGHVFNAANADGDTLFWDAQREIDGTTWFASATVTYFYRTDAGTIRP